MKNILPLLLLALCAVFASCKKDVLTGRGDTGTRTLNLPAFTAIETHHGISAQITYGPVPVVVMSGYENLLDALQPTVDNGVLRLRYDARYHRVKNDRMHARIILPRINSAKVHGSGNIDISGFIAQSQDFSATIHGSGNILLQNNIYGAAHYSIHGSGNIDGHGLECADALVRIHGSGRVHVRATRSFDGAIHGSGDIHVWGNPPQYQTSIQGSGRIIRR